jgi:acyl dehydratase
VSALLHFEDFSVGQVFALGPRVVTAEEIKAFALEFDPQPFHLDEEAAKTSVLGGLSASGFHSGALMLRMICDAFLSNSSVLGSSNMDSLTWLKPVHAGDELTGLLEVTGLRRSNSRPHMGVMNFKSHLKDQSGVRKVELAGTFFFGRRAA